MVFPSKKPSKWAITPALVAPEWQWFWDDARCFYPLWDYPLGSAPAKNIQAFGSLPHIAVSPATASTHLDVVSTPFGDAIRSERNAAEHWDSLLPSSTVIPSTTTSATLFFFARLNNTTADQRPIAFARAAGGTAFALLFGRANDNVSAFARNSAGGLIQLDSGATYTAGEIVTIVVTIRHNDLKIYLRGELANSETTADVPNTLQDMITSNFVLNDVEADCDSILPGVSLRAWSADQVHQWSRDPFGPLRMADEVGVVVGVVVEVPGPEADSLIPWLRRRRR